VSWPRFEPGTYIIQIIRLIILSSFLDALYFDFLGSADLNTANSILQDSFFPKQSQFSLANFCEMHIRFLYEISGENSTFDANMGFKVTHFTIQLPVQYFKSYYGEYWNDIHVHPLFADRPP